MSNTRTVRFMVSLVAAAALCLSCDEKVERKGFDQSPVQLPDSCVPYVFSIDSLPYNQLPNIGYNLDALNDTAVATDPLGVVMYRYKDAMYYHPVELAHRSLRLLAAFHGTGDSTWLKQLLRHVDRTLREAIEIDGALYYPYHYDNWVNQQEEGYLRAPWFSGMAQGEILGVLTRTFLVTGDSLYLRAADRTFATMLRPQGESVPWTVFFDSLGCYWIEEYPTPIPSKTLNGFIFGLYGVYDYYQLTKSPEAYEVLQQSLRTIKNYIPSFRRPGKPSLYGLRFGHFAGDYHMIHINQLRMLQRMTGDPAFGEWADSLESDFRE